MALKILNFGSLNVDTIYLVDHIARPGETISSFSRKQVAGGKGLNQTIALARCGVPVVHAGNVGKLDGAPLLEALRCEGVDISFVSRIDIPSGHAIIQVDGEGENSILLFAGANCAISSSQMEKVFASFEEGDWLVLQNEVNALPELMEYAQQKKMKIAFNPSPITPEIFTLPLYQLDYLFVNETEARALCERAGKGIDLENDLACLFPNTMVALTLGEKGAVVLQGGKRYRHPACPVDVVDTTAAGDTFTGYFLGTLAKGHPIEQALHTASVAAGLAVSRMGASASIPLIVEVETLL